jgi:hypothetical protein
VEVVAEQRLEEQAPKETQLPEMVLQIQALAAADQAFKMHLEMEIQQEMEHQVAVDQVS